MRNVPCNSSQKETSGSLVYSGVKEDHPFPLNCGNHMISLGDFYWINRLSLEIYLTSCQSLGVLSLEGKVSQELRRISVISGEVSSQILPRIVPEETVIAFILSCILLGKILNNSLKHFIYM